MDYLLLIFILTIVICMGYILSKPFTRKSAVKGGNDLEEVLDEEYLTLLQDIKTIERYFNAGVITEAEYKTRVDERKAMAANRLRMENTSMEAQPVTNQAPGTPTEGQDLPKDKLPSRGSCYCPKCGDQVLKSDKFCMHCGHRLQP